MSSFCSTAQQSYGFKIHATDTKIQQIQKTKIKKNKHFVCFMYATLTKTNLITIAEILATVEV